jgi:lipopolysaccharide transport system ATP-binding protein
MLAGVTDPDAGVLVKRPKLNTQLLSVNLGFERILSGRENAVMAGMLLGKSRSEMTRLLETIKEFSELGDFFEEPVYSYSSGMVARLGFSVAIEAGPDVLLMDELLSVGDAHFREKSGRWIREARDRGICIVLVNHNQAMIDKFCDRKLEL